MMDRLTSLLCGSGRRETNDYLNEKVLPIRLKEENQTPNMSSPTPPPPLVQIYPLESKDGLIIKIEPPREPQDSNLNHIPCDIVLSIDISGSMGTDAPVPRKRGEEEENYGLSVLDLVKHSAKTILETLDEGDRIGIVTFSSRTTVLQPLTPVTESNKQEILSKIDGMKPSGMTNLWHGILDGLKLFNDPERGSEGRVPALLVLTDGIPNHMCPSQGYVPKLQSRGALPATIHTFGFGNSLHSGLLKSISEIGGGNYSFIPDAGMIGTVFVHAVANLQSTFANNAVLRLTYPSYLSIQETTGEAVEKQRPQQLTGDVPVSLTQLTIHLSNIQYGQSRDLYLTYSHPYTSLGDSESPPVITAILEYHHFTPHLCRSTAHQSLLSQPSHPPLSEEEIAYHISRSHLINFLSAHYPMNSTFEHTPLAHPPLDTIARLSRLSTILPCFRYPSSPLCASLISDIRGPPSSSASSPPIDYSNPITWTGQIALALSPLFFNKWGKHYLPSLAGAHSRQICNSFKDFGPLLYGQGSPLFSRCKKRLDEAFDSIPAPEPSLLLSGNYGRAAPGGGHGHGYGHGHGAGYKTLGAGGMGRYRDPDGSCFAGFAKVQLADGTRIRIGRLRKGMEVLTPKGGRKVVGVLKHEVMGVGMSLIGKGGLLITPWHPVKVQGKWVFPKEIERRRVRYTGSIYSVLLERKWGRDDDVDAHAVMVDGVWGVTMGHGLVRRKVSGKGGERDDVRAHEFFGDYEKVYKAMSRLRAIGHGLVLGGGVTRDRGSGLIDGFRRAEVRVTRTSSSAKVQRKKMLYG